MKTLKHLSLVALSTLFLMSCGGASNSTADAAGLAAIETEMKSKFGDDAYYTDISIGYDESLGLWASATATSDPASLTMGEWNYSQNDWKQTSEITLELPEGTKATDFMYQLKDAVSVKKMGELLEKSIEKLKAEKNVENPVLSLASVIYPDNGDAEKAYYSISLEPATGGTSFSFTYKLNGEFIEMDY